MRKVQQGIRSSDHHQCNVAAPLEQIQRGKMKNWNWVEYHSLLVTYTWFTVNFDPQPWPTYLRFPFLWTHVNNGMQLQQTLQLKTSFRSLSWFNQPHSVHTVNSESYLLTLCSLTSSVKVKNTEYLCIIYTRNRCHFKQCWVFALFFKHKLKSMFVWEHLGPSCSNSCNFIN